MQESMPEIGTGIPVFPKFRGSLIWWGWLEGSSSPNLDPKLQLFELRVIQREFIPPKALKAIQHLGEHDGSESVVLFSRELEQPGKAITKFESHEIDIIARFGSSKNGEHFVGGQLFGRQEVETRARLGREEAGIARQIDFSPFDLVCYHQASESRAVDNPIDLEVGRAKGSLGGCDQPVDGIGTDAKAVQIRVARFTSPRTIKAAPPARAKSSASTSPEMILAT